MSIEPPEGAELTEIEAALLALAPSPSRLNRDRLMFEAGARSRSAVLRRRWLWPSIAAGLAALVLGESAMLARRPAPQVIERVVVVREPVEPTPSPIRPAETAPDEAHPPKADSIDDLLAVRWTTVGDYRRGMTHEDEFVPTQADAPDSRPRQQPPAASVGELRRAGFAKLLNPGGRS